MHIGFEDLIDKIRRHVHDRIPLSLVRIGDGEAQLLALGSIATLEEVQRHPYFWPERDFIPKPTEPKTKNVREDVIWATRNADIVAINNYNDKWLWIGENLKRPLEDKVFAALGISPAITCDQGCNRTIIISPYFWDAMSNKKVLLINKHGPRGVEAFKKCMERWGRADVQHIFFGDYKDSGPALEAATKLNFDVALVSAAFYGKRLTVELAKRKGVVSIDFGTGIDLTMNGIWSV